RLPIHDRHDHITVVRPPVLAIVLAWSSRVIWMAVVKPQHSLPILLRLALGRKLHPRVDRKPVVSLVCLEYVLPLHQPFHNPPLHAPTFPPLITHVPTTQDPAALIWKRGRSLTLDLPPQLRFQNQRHHGQFSASLVTSCQKLSDKYLAAESEKIVTTTPSFNS